MKNSTATPSVYLDVIIAGFGGQGILLMGNLLAYAAMEEGLHVTFIPVYGAEMRGGTANCTVVISSDEIGSPLIRSPHSLIIMNKPSYDKFVPCLAKKGLCIVNSSLVKPEDSLADAEQVYVDTNALILPLGNPRLANMAALGAYLARTQIVPLQVAQRALHHVIGAHYSKLIPLNEEALALGYASVCKV